MNSIFVKENGFYNRINISEILYVEGAGNYVKIFTQDKNHFVQYSLGCLETFLQEEKFLRIHKSYLVAKNKVTRFSRSKIFIDTIALPIGTTYCTMVMSEFNILEKTSLAGELHL